MASRDTMRIYTGRPGTEMSIENLGRGFGEMSVGRERPTSKMDELTASMGSMNLGYGSRGPTYSSTDPSKFKPKGGKKYRKSRRHKKSRKHRKTRRYGKY